MNVAYVTMQFPVPSETFSSQDINALISQGNSLVVYGLRPRHKHHAKIMKERSHAGLEVKNFGLVALYNFVLFSIFHPKVLLCLLSWIFTVNRKSNRHVLKSMILVPSVMSVFADIKKRKLDVVHLFWGHYPAMVGHLVERFCNQTLVSMFLGAHDLEENYSGSVDLANRVKLVFTHSHSNLAVLSRRGIDLKYVHVVHRGTRVELLEEEPAKFERLTCEPMFVTAARLIEDKGVDDVLKIFASILERYPRAQLSIAGDGPHRKFLENLTLTLGCADRVTFLGHIPQSDLIRIMKVSHFFILMSRYAAERLPNAVKEAMCQGCVVITTDTSGISELIDDGVNGFVVRKGDWEAAAACVDKCMSSPTLAKKIAVLANRHIASNFDVEASMLRYLEVWLNEVRLRRGR